MKHILKLVVVMLPVLLLIACGGTQEKPEEDAGDKIVVSPAPQEEVAPPVVADVTGEPEEEDLSSELKIYFDFDRSEVKPEFRAIVEAHANKLASNPGISVTLEGHCDERGTTEYNIALGERRSSSVEKMLKLLGASGSQIKTVSFGEEQPDVEGHDESAWKWNRRVVFVYSE